MNDLRRTVRYTAPTPGEAERAFVADQAREVAAGYRIARSSWDTREPQPTLVVEYKLAPTAAPAPDTPAALSTASLGPSKRTRRRGMVGIVVLAVIVLVAIGLANRRDSTDNRAGLVASASPSPTIRVTAPPTVEPSSAATDRPGAMVASSEPLAAVDAQPGTGGARSVRRDDGTGDLVDADTGRTGGRPRYADIVAFRAEIRGGELAARFDLAGPAPGSLDPLHTTVHYYVLIDTDGDGSEDWGLGIGSVEDWSVDLFDYDEAFDHQKGVGSVVDDLVLLRVPLSEIGSPGRFAVHGYTEWTDFPDPQGDPSEATTVQDRVPNREDRWLALSVD
jgi:hypothetical protein